MALIDGLVSYYKMNDDAASTAVDDELDANEGTATFNTEDRSVAGKINTGLDIESTTGDYINLGNDASFNTDEMSFSGWVKPESYPGVDNTVMGKWSANKYIMEVNADGTVHVIFVTAGGDNNATSVATLNTGTWYHLVATWDSTTGATIYINGVEDGTNNDNPGALQSSTGDTQLGALIGSVAPFDGVIDECGFWNRPLSEAEAITLYNDDNGDTYPFAIDHTESLSDSMSFSDSIETESKTTLDYVTTDVQVNGVSFNDYRNLKIKRTMHDSNASSSFTAVFDSPFGRHSSDFTVGQTIDIFADKIDATEKIFSGILEKIQFRGKGTKQTITLSGRDYSLRLQDITAAPQVFNNTEVSSIVTQLLSSNDVPDITTNNVEVTTTTLPRMSYNHESIFDAFNELATLSQSIFWVDEDKDLHWIPRKSTSSGITIGNSQNNLLDTDLNRSREGMANVVWVYGDRYLSGFKEELSMDGSSTYTLLSRPHNTEILQLGSTLKGSVKDITLTPTSGADYEVSFFDRTIDFLSGTDLGYSSVPASGGSVIVNYQRELPIVKRGQDDDSIKFYGPKVIVVRDKSIKDPNTALNLLKGKLLDANPLNRLKCNLKGWYSFSPADTVIYDLKDFNMSELEMSIVEISYNFNKNSVNEDNTISLVLSKKLLDITDKIKELDRRLVNIEAPDISDTDVVTRLIQSREEFTVVGSVWNVYTSSVTGSGYHLYDTNFTPPVNPWHLASGTDQGAMAGSFTGSAIIFTPFALQYSGGNNYEITGSYNPIGSEPPGGFGTQSTDYG